MDHWLKEMWPPSSIDYFMWCVVEIEVNKCPHITQVSLKAMISNVMTNLEREVVMPACKESVLGV
jgi:hypothetical protein